MLSKEQIAFYHEEGYLRIPEMFTPAETREMRAELNWLIESWAEKSAGWSGPWRKVYMDEKTEKKSQLIALHDLQFYSQAWMQAVTNRRLTEVMSDLLGPNVELHHSTLHVKPPESGHPFPMHQDYAFYKHADGRYVDTLVHLDDTRHENGEIRFLAKSHKLGALDHIIKDPETGQGCTPHLPTDKFSLEETIAVPAKAGDVVLFHIWTIHGSHINVTDDMRRLVRIGYRDPENKQLTGQSVKRPGLMVRGRRPQLAGQTAFSVDAA